MFIDKQTLNGSKAFEIISQSKGHVGDVDSQGSSVVFTKKGNSPADELNDSKTFSINNNDFNKIELPLGKSVSM